VNANPIESQQINSGIASTARLKRIHKDRQRRPAQQMRQNGEKPSDSNSHHNSESEPHNFSKDTQEDIHLRNELEEFFEKKLSFPQKKQRADTREQGKRIDVVI
jgi:hypothetical protein